MGLGFEATVFFIFLFEGLSLRLLVFSLSVGAQLLLVELLGEPTGYVHSPHITHLPDLG